VGEWVTSVHNPLKDLSLPTGSGAMQYLFFNVTFEQLLPRANNCPQPLHGIMVRTPRLDAEEIECESDTCELVLHPAVFNIELICTEPTTCHDL
jgi:hypothetical protein